jgi:hypothetical protein
MLTSAPGNDAMNESLRDSFLRTAEAWVTAGYDVNVRYLTVDEAGQRRLYAALIALNPLPLPEGMDFRVEAGRVTAGQFQFRAGENAPQLLESACTGQLKSHAIDANFGVDARLDYFSDNPDPNRAGVDLHLRITADNQLSLSTGEIADIDAQLRRANPPFDGLVDLCGWLGLANPASHGRQSSIDIRIFPPADFGDELKVENNRLVVTIRALEGTDLSQIELALRCAPGVGLSRYLVGKKIQWAAPVQGIQLGRLELHLENADVVQCMLSLGPRTIRRHVLVDPTRARTLRLAAVMAMDPGLAALTNSLRPDKERDAARFEKGVATLLFLHGFIPTPQADTDAPDLLVGTPGGRLALVECTLKFADFNAKVAKLAARRNRLVLELRAKGHAADVHAVLVCPMPKSEIVGLDELELAGQNVTLVTSETLAAALDRVQSKFDPDEILMQASAALVETQRRSNPM